MRNWIALVEGAIAEADKFTGSTFADDAGNQYSVEKLYAIARANAARYLRRDFPISRIEHDLEWWDAGLEDGGQSHDHMLTVDTSYPILVLKQPDGHLTVCDGLNRMKKARDVEHRDTIDAYVIPWTPEMQDSVRV